MTEHLGVIRLDDQEIAVAVELAPTSIRLVTDQLLVGDWTYEECQVVRNASGGYDLQAEGDSLEFDPIDLAAFEKALATKAGGTEPHLATLDELPEALAAKAGETERVVAPLDELPKAVAPKPRPITLVLFYALLALTILLATWATWSLLS